MSHLGLKTCNKSREDGIKKVDFASFKTVYCDEGQGECIQILEDLSQL